jgi:hypothetical protein
VIASTGSGPVPLHPGATTSPGTSLKPGRSVEGPRSGATPKQGEAGIINGGEDTPQLVQDSDFDSCTSSPCTDPYWIQSSSGHLETVDDYYYEDTGWDDGVSDYTADLCGYESCTDYVEQPIVVPYDVTAATMTFDEAASCNGSAGCGGSGTNDLVVGIYTGSSSTSQAMYMNPEASGYVQEPPASWALNQTALLSWLQSHAGQEVYAYAEAATISSDTTEWFVTDIDLTLQLGNTAVSTEQYHLASSDGATWQAMDPTNLLLTITPTAAENVLLSANSDLWTAEAGYNQDIGIMVTPGAGTPVLAAWKESGGFAGTFSPNAAFVQTVYPMAADTTYTVEIVWKTNKPAPGVTIYAGAGPIGTSYSPTWLSADPLIGGDFQTFVSTEQYHLTSSDGSTWQPIDTSHLSTVAYTPSVTQTTLLSGNADLWTANAGYNQDLGIFVSVNSATPTLVAWKESGGFAGTFSPNAAFVQTAYKMTAGDSYVFSLEWKTNKPAPGATIYAGAGPISGAYSPTRLTGILMLPNTEPTGWYSAFSTLQYHLSNSDGSTWQVMDATKLESGITIPGGTAESVLVSGNADLWTANLGYNQDLGIFVSENGGTPTLLAWKESGGYAGTFSPNAAFVQGVMTLYPSTSYTFYLEWKTNKAAPGATIYAGAGPIGTAYSPTSLTFVAQT